MNRFFFIFTLAVLLTSVAFGQENARFSLQIAMGNSYPVGQEKTGIVRYLGSPSMSGSGARFYVGPYYENWNDAESGINFSIGAGLNIRSKTWIRGRFSSHNFKVTETRYQILDETYPIYSFGLDVLYYPNLRLSRIMPYVFAGSGMSSRNDDMTDAPVYITVGAGFEVPLRYRLAAVIEMSYLRDEVWETSRTYLPVYLGIKSYFGRAR